MNTPTVRVTDPECPEGLTWVGTKLEFLQAITWRPHWTAMLEYPKTVMDFKWTPYDTVLVEHGEEFSIRRIDLSKPVITPPYVCRKCSCVSNSKEMFAKHNCNDFYQWNFAVYGSSVEVSRRFRGGCD